MVDVPIDLDTTALLVTGSVSGLMSKEGQDEDDNGDPFEFLSFSLSYSLACLQMGGEDRLSERGARISRLLFDYPQTFSSLSSTLGGVGPFACHACVRILAVLVRVVGPISNSV